jgi:dihydropteroate synthase
MAKLHPWILRDRTFNWGDRTYVMGVLNVTPDSFSDGGQFNSLETGMAQAQQLIQSGVDILDIGGQSTRPGSQPVPIEAELRRVVPVIEAIRQSPDPALQTAVISVDTTRAEVARAAVRAGADLINDISGGTFDHAMLSTVADLGVPIVLMHLRGTPATMQQKTDYEDLLGDIIGTLKRQVQAAIAAGVNASRIIVDPGIGFGKSYPQNLEILRQIPALQVLDCPILIGPSRKSFIGWILDQPDPTQRVWGTAAACCAAIAGGADILRIHDGREMVEVSRVADAVWRPQRP